jgi:dCTP deaminase
MPLSDSEIRKRLENGSLVVHPMPADENIQPASVDVHLADTILYFPRSSPTLSPDNVPSMTQNKIGLSGMTLLSGDFVLGSTQEWIEVPPTLSARAEGKSSIGRLGLLVHATAGFIDPGFRGNVTLELKNISNVPITLTAGMEIGQLCFEKVTGKVLRPYGSDGLGSHYQDSKGTKAAQPRRRRKR